MHAVLTTTTSPASKTFGLEFSDQPVLADDVVRYVGQPVAIVAAETPEQARAAARSSTSTTSCSGRPRHGGGAGTRTRRMHEFGNVLRHVRIVHGDPDAPRPTSGSRATTRPAMQDQARARTRGRARHPGRGRRHRPYVATQWLHVDRQQIAPCLDLPEEKVRITLAGVGGAFGSARGPPRADPRVHAGAATGRPVKMSYGREESFLGHVHRHPSRIWSATARRATAARRRVGRLLIDGGAYASSSPAVIANATTFVAGPVRGPERALEGTAVYTNNPPCGAMRGFGAPQVCFAHEARWTAGRGLGIDPVELRLRNALAHRARCSRPVR